MVVLIFLFVTLMVAAPLFAASIFFLAMSSGVVELMVDDETDGETAVETAV